MIIPVFFCGRGLVFLSVRATVDHLQAQQSVLPPCFDDGPENSLLILGSIFWIFNSNVPPPLLNPSTTIAIVVAI